MPQNSGPETKADKEIAAAAARILDDVRAEPVPDPILVLARKLDRTLATQRGKSDEPAG